jgi:hypothetical protein
VRPTLGCQPSQSLLRPFIVSNIQSARWLRKAAATRCAENGATTAELMALLGWKTEKMALY